MNDKWWVIGSLVINGLFFVDIGLNFRTAYVHSRTGEEIQDGWKVAMNYIFG